MHVFIFQLNAHNRTALMEIQSVYLVVDGPVQSADTSQVTIVIVAHFKGFAIEPIRQAAVTHLAVVKRSNSQNDHETVLFAQLNKTPYIPVAIEAEGSLYFLMHIPEHIGGNEIDTAALGFDERIFPLISADTAVMDLAADAEEGDAVYLHRYIGETYRRPLGSSPRKFLPRSRFSLTIV